jgi:hypothetical protein
MDGVKSMVLQLSHSTQKSLLALDNQQRGWAKQAELGGDGQDIPFEQALSNLAHAYLRDKAPSLLDFEVGFQLLERNQENTKAVGVVGFKVGSMWLYVPIFFLRGELKGHELLYIKDQDVFVPLKENWLNYLLSRKPNILGDGTNKDTHQLGVMSPSLQQLSNNRVKSSSAYPAWVEDFLPVWAYMATTPTSEQEKFANMRTFPEMLAAEGGNSVKFMYEVANRYPSVFKAATELYGDKLSGALKEACELHKKASNVLTPAQPTNKRISRTGPVIDTTIPHPIKTGALEIITMDHTRSETLPEGPDEEDQEKLLRDGVLIKDERAGDEVSVAYKTQVEKRLFNPAESGLYEVLTNTGDIERCFIVLAPMGPNGRFKFATLVRVEGGGKKDWINVHPTRVWAVSKVEGDEYNDWLEGLSVPDSLSKGSTYMLCGRTGECTVPFRVEGTIGDADGKIVYNVNFHTHAERGRAVYEAGHRVIPFSGDDEYSPYRDGQRIHLKGKGGSKLVASQGDVFVPEDFYAIPVAKPADDFDSDRKEPLAPGNIADAEMMIMAKTAELTIYHNGYEVELNKLRMEPKQAFIALIKDHGFREKQAREMLREAEQKHKARYRVKYAEYVKQAQDPFLQPGPTAPGFPGPQMGTTDVIGGQVPAQFPMSTEQPVADMYRGDPSQYDPTLVPDPMAMQGAQQAAQLGQKDVFDTAMIGSMLKAVRQDSMVDKYLGDLMKGMDRVGRILFMFYFHQDDFGDRYGKADMPELEDSLRNTFESMGDLVLFLKQKSVDPYPEEGSLGVDLGPIAGT